VPPPPISLPGVALPSGPAPAHDASSRGYARPQPLTAAPSSLPSPRLEPPSMARAPAPPQAPPAVAILSPRPAPFAAAKPLPPSPRPEPMHPSRGRDKPNLLVATMFGLRAFGKGKAAPAEPRGGAAPGPSAPPRAGVLGLGREARRQPSDA